MSRLWMFVTNLKLTVKITNSCLKPIDKKRIEQVCLRQYWVTGTYFCCNVMNYPNFLGTSQIS